MEPSQYIVNLKKLLDSKEKLYNEYLQDINNSIKELETNLDLYKKKIYSLENVKSKLLSEIKNYNDLLEKTNAMENNNKYSELTEKLKTLLPDFKFTPFKQGIKTVYGRLKFENIIIKENE